MKGIAIGLSNTSKVILKRLKKTEFIDEIYIASSSYEKKYQENQLPTEKVRVQQLMDSLEEKENLDSLEEEQEND